MAKRRKQSGGISGRDVESAVNAFQRMDPRAQFVVVILLLVVGLIALFVYWRNQEKARQTTAPPPAAPPVVRTEPPTAVPQPGVPPAVADVSTGPVNMLLGNPSGATADPANRSNYLMVKPYFTVAYDDATGTPRWVSWRLTREDISGQAPRKQLFDPDTTLPAGFYRVTHKDYSGSGFDRGHMCPHADRDATEAMSFATFVMTNIIPQAPNVNQKTWADLEDYCRLLARQGNRLYITAGPSGQGGTGSAGEKQTLAGGRVTVPAECWKVIVVVPGGGGGSTDDLANINASARVIAVVMPNDNGIGLDWTRYRTSAGDVEQRTGLHFFDRLPADVAAALRAKVDTLPVAGGAVAPVRHRGTR